MRTYILKRFDLSAYDQEQLCQNFENNAKIMKKVSLDYRPLGAKKKTFKQMKMFFWKVWRSTHQAAMSHLSVLVNAASRWNLVITWVFLPFQSGILKQDCRLDLDEWAPSTKKCFLMMLNLLHLWVTNNLNDLTVGGHKYLLRNSTFVTYLLNVAS